MKIGTMSIVVGDKRCNVNCPFCVSKQTESVNIKVSTHDINWRNLSVGFRLAKQSNVSTILLTGAGEPTMHPELITQYVDRAREYDFPFIELQTNGVLLKGMVDWLTDWYKKGMTLVCLFVTHWYNDANARLMPPKAGDSANLNIWKTVELLHNIGFSVRLNCTMMKGGIDNHEDLEILLNYCRNYKVEQLTMRDITASSNPTVIKWVLEAYLKRCKATPIMQLGHGATVYDCEGQNIAVNNCLTTTLEPNEIRQLIFFPDGHLRYDWVYKGAVIL